MISLIIFFLILNSWLIWNSFLFFYILKYDASFDFIIFNRAQLIKYWFYVLGFVLFGFYVFTLRLQKIHYSINFFEVEEKFWTLFYSFSEIELVVIFLELVIILIFWFFLAKVIFNYFTSTLLALYLYYLQYNFFREYICFKLVDIQFASTLYLQERVRLFTENRYILTIAFIIWPMLFIWVEKTIFKFILPYLFIFDYLTQEGHLNKIFLVLPWYYIYMLIRSTIKLLQRFFTPVNTDFSMDVYQSMKVDGKIIRWVAVGENVNPNKTPEE